MTDSKQYRYGVPLRIARNKALYVRTVSYLLYLANKSCMFKSTKAKWKHVESFNSLTKACSELNCNKI